MVKLLLVRNGVDPDEPDHRCRIPLLPPLFLQPRLLSQSLYSHLVYRLPSSGYPFLFRFFLFA